MHSRTGKLLAFNMLQKSHHGAEGVKRKYYADFRLEADETKWPIRRQSTRNVGPQLESPRSPSTHDLAVGWNKKIDELWTSSVIR